MALVPTGAYVNEADPSQENYHEVFRGENYPILLAIKRAVDPDDVFSTMFAWGTNDGKRLDMSFTRCEKNIRSM